MNLRCLWYLLILIDTQAWETPFRPFILLEVTHVSVNLWEDKGSIVWEANFSSTHRLYGGRPAAIDSCKHWPQSLQNLVYTAFEMWWHTRRNQISSFRLSAKRTSPFKSVGVSVQSTAGSRGVRISGSNAGYTKFRGSVKNTGHPLHSPVSPSLPLPFVTVCHHISTGLYKHNSNCIEHVGTPNDIRHDSAERDTQITSLPTARSTDWKRTRYILPDIQWGKKIDLRMFNEHGGRNIAGCLGIADRKWCRRTQRTQYKALRIPKVQIWQL